jgi:signal peptidase I
MTQLKQSLTPWASQLRSWVRPVFDVVCIVLIVTAAKSAIAEPYFVPSGSMEPTLQIGDELLATKYPYGYSSASLPSFLTVPITQRILKTLPRRGDVVVFRWPGNPSQVWVKRVIGLPGDRIAMRDGRLRINGTPVGFEPDAAGQAETENGSLIPAAKFIETLPGNRSHEVFKLEKNAPQDNFSEIIVPSDHLFVMGDNRDNSADSRFSVAQGGVGMLPVGNLIGRVEVVIGSWNLALKSKPISTWPSGLRLSRFFTAVH